MKLKSRKPSNRNVPYNIQILMLLIAVLMLISSWIFYLIPYHKILNVIFPELSLHLELPSVNLIMIILLSLFLTLTLFLYLHSFFNRKIAIPNKHIIELLSAINEIKYFAPNNINPSQSYGESKAKLYCKILLKRNLIYENYDELNKGSKLYLTYALTDLGAEYLIKHKYQK